MRLILSIFIIGITLIPLTYSTPVSLGDGFYLPTLENVEFHIDNLWSNFKKGYGIVYNTSAEEIHRFKIFANHVKMIIKHNLEHDLGLHTYRLGINKYATLVNRTMNKIKFFILYYLFSRQMKNFVDNLMDIVVKKILVRNSPMLVVHIFLHLLI
jgi:hypothetical protein